MDFYEHRCCWKGVGKILGDELNFRSSGSEVISPTKGTTTCGNVGHRLVPEELVIQVLDLKICEPQGIDDEILL